MARGKSGGHPGKRRKHKLRVIEKPEGRAVIRQVPGTVDPPIKGTGRPGSIDYVCGTCETVLLGGMDHTQRVVDIVLVCPSCGAYNDAGGAPELN